MPTTGKQSKKSRLRRLLAEKKPEVIGEVEWKTLLAELAPISESYLRGLLHETGIPFEQPFAGVRQKSFEDLEQSLIAMESVYRRAMEAGDRHRAQYCRNLVIQSKEHARLAARSPKTSAETKGRKEEMLQWMQVWLENPGVFPVWVEIRKRAQGRPGSGANDLAP